MVQKLKIAAAGLGRMGARHAINFLHRTPRAELVAAFTPDPKELAWARTNLEPHGVTLYTDYDEMIKQEGLQAVVIGTATSVHAEEAIKAMHQGLHVLCEKPLSTSIPVCKQVLDEALKHPHLKVMCGFSRRFDESYRDAWEKMDRGLIGRPTIIRSQTCDKHDPSGFFVEYAAWSGGVFVDMSVHDIDLALWFFGDDIQVKSVSAYGVRAVQPELAKYNDYDNAMGIVEFWNGRVANFYCSRMMAHGQEDVTEIIGTEGKLTVNGLAQKNHVQYYGAQGVTREIPAHYYGRFEQAFVGEANEFAAACLDNTALPLKLRNAVKAVEIGALLQEALVKGIQIRLNEAGQRISDTPAAKL
ncbi:NAD(P)-binding protein [Aureobasidium pullulans]|uniref:NAD(P)-binding protein n=1 Tax=Aureobasidium pullulans TaxID=5580 RepID=A0A4T0CJP0_AURPU|nr:NAD(P)-binding protein [Aureobasidium pullulans]THX55393.1 NAD(P)-binding protein [Aureobasidium pullulans]THY54646.1 NAD(P)-binding protein [Aureobasidium pullulans]THZ26519.1 NAD(P)-binding protein [Aureobasidium pullulans]TIA45312.1 NAD(P)-binding protein [Aureobasidium pullulans]